ncbi:N-acetylglucosamine-6-phosphate deacetylase [Falsibacillus pallidus]|uniref:N-acetylglucosamine-6-phosphate deacetylase n=1 Tax=Falsibacillus pallidus TaxID=493781 RepID=A0A370GCF4_9BACI|nr:N-acetylglucosamine-6-phosphate deacetylase [Falsibacillus pallidus]RDI41391.1 N-acetylglucosamine 6-phosphate deacetylase [Falsibacillus pallidus]
MNTTQDTILKGCSVFLEDRVLDCGFIQMKGRKIINTGTIDEIPTSFDGRIIDLPPAYKLVPGFIDVHIHGAAGADTMDGTSEAMQTITTALPKEGTTSFLATTITQSDSQIEQALKNAAAFAEIQQPGQAEVLGIHLEGPFINSSKAGAQPKEYIKDPDIALFDKWNEAASQLIKLVTLAPELSNGEAFVKHLSNNGIIASIGHSDADYIDVKQAVEAGATHVTHLFNGMKGLHHREPGTAGAALKLDELKVELIVDGIHIHPEMMDLVYRMKQAERMILITDSMRAKCLKNGVYDLGGQEVSVADGKALLKDGTLAGSILKMNEAVQNMTRYLNAPLIEIIKMATEVPAKQLNVYDRKGSLSSGKDADIVLLDEELQVASTWCRGQLAYQRED